MAKWDFCRSMKDAGILFGSRKKNREIFLGCEKKGLRDFFGYVKKLVIFLGMKYEPLSDLPVIKILSGAPGV